MKDKTNWGEWIYCGVGSDIKEDVIDEAIKEHFLDSILYFVSTRKGSSEINKQDILEKIKKELAQNELFIWDTNFKKVIKFDKIGVMVNGVVPTGM